MINFTCKGQETLGLFPLWWPSWTLAYIIRNQVSRQKYWLGCRIIWRTDVLMETECQSEMPRWPPLESGTIFTSCSAERHTHTFFFFFNVVDPILVLPNPSALQLSIHVYVLPSSMVILTKAMPLYVFITYTHLLHAWFQFNLGLKIHILWHFSRHVNLFSFKLNRNNQTPKEGYMYLLQSEGKKKEWKLFK